MGSEAKMTSHYGFEARFCWMHMAEKMATRFFAVSLFASAIVTRLCKANGERWIVQIFERCDV